MNGWYDSPAKPLDPGFNQKAMVRQAQLTKPPGSLGRLEDAAIILCAMQHTLEPAADNVEIAVFAGDHGVTVEGVSAFPQIVTAEMVKNFINGGAAISVPACGQRSDLPCDDVCRTARARTCCRRDLR